VKTLNATVTRLAPRPAHRALAVVLTTVILSVIALNVAAQQTPPRDSARPPDVVSLDYRRGTMDRYNLALRSYLKRDFEAAERYAEATLQFEPDAIEAQWLLANIYHRTGRLGSMMEIARELGIREARESRFAYDILREGSKGYILSVSDDIVTVDFIEADGAAPGEGLVIYEEGVVLRHPVTLEILDVDQPARAEAEIVQVFDNYSVARITSSTAPVNRGMRAIFAAEYENFFYQQQISGAPAATPQTTGDPSFGTIDLSQEFDGVTLTDPEGFFLAGDGNLFVVDTGNHRIVKLDQDRSFVRAAGFQGTGPDEFQNPVDITLFQGQLVVVERGNHRLNVLDQDLNPVRIVGSRGIGAPGRFNLPTKAVAEGGSLYVLDSGNQRVQVFNTNLEPTGAEFNASSAQDTPTSFTIIPGVALVVLDYIGGQALYFDLNSPGAPVRTLQLPSELANKSISDVVYARLKDRDVLAYTLDIDHQVAIVDAESQELISMIGSRGTRAGNFNQPIQIRADGERLQVLERRNNRLQVIRNVP
jgi:DNA-binding beta-propeller fold protein YncE